MPNILALFALFAVVSAANDDGCTNGSAGYCKKDGIIGKCDGADGSKSCDKTKVVECGTVEDSGPTTCGAKNEKGLSGYCKAKNGDCIAGQAPIKVTYVVRVPDNSRTSYNASSFKAGFSTKLGLNTYDENPTKCPANAAAVKMTVDDPVDKGTLACTGDYLYAESNDMCTLTCESNYSTKTKQLTKCGTGGTWEVSTGSCEKNCPASLPTGGATGVLAVDASTQKSTYTFAGTEEKGTLICTDVNKGSANTLCKITCEEGYRVSTLSTMKCGDQVTPAWTGGVRGACESSDNLHASVNISLADTYNLENVKAKQDQAFNSKFKKAVSDTLGDNYFPANVSILEIENAARRRLNEKSDKVDSTGLRGIR